MAGAVDTYMLERKLGADAAKKLRSAFKNAIKNSVNSKGESSRSTVTARYKNQRLDRITFAAPHYIFKQHYGFEGSKKNGINMRLKATEVLNKAIDESGVLETLADGISDIRAEQVITAINFLKRGR